LYVIVANQWHDTKIGSLSDNALELAELPDEAGEKDGELRLEIVDDTSHAVAEARVTVFAIRDEHAYLAARELTPSSGAPLTLRALPRGELWVLAEAASLQRASSRIVLLAEPRPLRLVLGPAHALTLNVHDDHGAPLAHAHVEVQGKDPINYGGSTDKEGRLHLAQLGASPWHVEVSHPGYETFKKRFVDEQKDALPVTLALLGQLDLTVVAVDGTPAAEANVWVTGTQLWPARQATTDAQGAVRLGGLAAGAYHLAAVRGSDISETHLAVPLARGESKPFELRLGPGRSLPLRVVAGDEEQAPAVGEAHVLAVEDGIALFPREAITDAQGQATVGPFAAAPVVVIARAPGFVASSPRLIAPTETGLTTLHLTPGVTLRGDVVDSHGASIGGASLEVIGVDSAGMPIDETSQRRAFQASHFAQALAGPRPLLPAGELGVMAGPLPRIPQPGLASQSALGRASASTASAAREAEPWVTLSNGTFRLAVLPPGRLRVLARHPSYVEAMSEAVTVAPGAEATVRVTLRGGASLEGRVVDALGRPVAGARLEIMATYGTLQRTMVTAGDGTFGFAAVPSDITLTVTRPGSDTAPVVRKELSLREASRNEITLTLPSARDAVNLRVVDERGAGLGAAQVSVTSLDPDVPLRRTEFTQNDGRAVVPDAAGLPLRLVVALPGRASITQSFESTERNVTLTLPRGVRVQGEVTTRAGREALEGADVTVITAAGIHRARTNREGLYTLADLPPGPAAFAVTHAGYARREVEFSIPSVVRDRPTAMPRINLDEGGSVEGQVLDTKGDAVMGARVGYGAVGANVPLGPLPPGSAVSDAQGRFRLADVPVGSLTLEAVATGKGRGSERGIRVRAGRVTSDVRVRLTAADDAGQARSAAGSVAITVAAATSDNEAGLPIVHVAPGSEAERAGLRMGDGVLTIGHHRPTSPAHAHELLAGPLGDDVLLRIHRNTEEMLLRVPRERVQ